MTVTFQPRQDTPWSTWPRAPRSSTARSQRTARCQAPCPRAARHPGRAGVHPARGRTAHRPRSPRVQVAAAQVRL